MKSSIISEVQHFWWCEGFFRIHLISGNLFVNIYSLGYFITLNQNETLNG